MRTEAVKGAFREAARLLCLLLSTSACNSWGHKSAPPAETNPAPRKSATGASPERLPEPEQAPIEGASSPPAPLSDRGIFPEYDEEISTQCPSWLSGGPYLRVRYPGSKRVWKAVDGVIVCEELAGGDAHGPVVPIASTNAQDQDADGVPDAVDILRGAKKAEKNGASYKSSYRELEFPGGDVPRTEGVCTDVVVRSLRNTGTDLQQLLFNDIGARPHAYPMVKKRDPHIDHRRVKTLLPYFLARWESLIPDPKDTAAPYLPGDIVFMNTMGDGEPEHMGIVSDRVGGSGLPLIINNWTDGTVTKSMDLLGTVPVTHRFRSITRLELPKDSTGLSGVLLRQGLSVPPDTRQVLLVTTPLWESSGGTLTRWRRSGDRFERMGAAVSVRIGSRGLGKGRGVSTPRGLAPTPKKEGDKRAPAGVFRLGTAFGRPPAPPYSGHEWPYRAIGAGDFWTDDPASPEYNRWITWGKPGAPSWSAERLSMYSLGLVVEHNTSDPVPGAGSAIFIHPWKTPRTPTVGCTALDEDRLREILAWLDPEENPVLVQVADHVF